MGFWRGNPPEPCCNPPAGYCQCQPCRWRVVNITGPPITQFGEDYLEKVGLPHAMEGWTSHAEWLANDVISVRPKPWFRFWRKEIEVTYPPAPPLRHFLWFGYGRWVISGATSLDLPLFDEVTWGFGFSDSLELAPHNGLEPGLSDVPQESEAPLWFHYEALAGPWKCWGRNRLYHWNNLNNPDYYIEVEPDV